MAGAGAGVGCDLEGQTQDQGKVGRPAPSKDGDIISTECPGSISAFQDQ